MNRRDMLTGMVGAAVAIPLGVKAVAPVVFTACESFSMAGAKLVSFINHGVEVCFIDKDGALHFPDLKHDS